MTHTPDDDSKKARKPRRPRKPPSKYANAKYEIGKGKPPTEHQFKVGGKSPNPKGRPKGSRNKTPLQRLLAKRVVVGRDEAGRPIRKTLAEAIDHKLVEQATKGDMRAIELIKKTESEFAKLERGAGPSPQELEAKYQEDAERKKYAAKLRMFIGDQFDAVAQLKKAGLIITTATGIKVSEWALEALSAHEKAKQTSAGELHSASG